MGCREEFPFGVIFPPPSTCCGAGQIGFEQVTFVPGIEQQKDAWLDIVGAIPAVLSNGQRKLALWQICEVTQFDSQITFQWIDEFRIPFRNELVVKRLHGRIIPEKPLGRLMAGGAQRCAIGYGQKKQRVRRQQIFNRWNGGAVRAWLRHDAKQQAAKKFRPCVGKSGKKFAGS